MENITLLAETTGKSPKVYKNVIKEDRLPLYEEAAKKSGYGVNVTARAGEKILVGLVGDKSFVKAVPDKVTVSPGCVEVAVTVPPGQEKVGTGPFYKVVKELGQPSK